MIKNIVSVAALLGAGALVTGCSFDQPSAGCITQDSSSWQARYDLKEGQSVPEGCAALMKGELLGVYKFADPKQPGSATLTIRPAGLASRGSRDPGKSSQQTAVGKLADEPDAQDFCSATGFTEATVNAAADEEEGATSISYQFDNVKVYAAPRAPGTQLTGELKLTRDGCTLEYGVRAIWPSVKCDPASTKPESSCGEGSGVNPDFAVECDPDLKRCVPSKAIPSFKD